MKLLSLLIVLIGLLTIGCKPSKLKILQHAEELAKKGKYQQAINLCNKVILRDGTIQLAYLQRGKYFTKMKECLYERGIVSKSSGRILHRDIELFS